MVKPHMTDQILLLLPTRGRPWNALEAVASIKKTATRPDDVHLCVCQDLDDPHRLAIADKKALFCLFPLFGERWKFVQWLNYGVLRITLDIYSHIGWAADDIRYVTPGWDDILRTHAELVVFGPDGYQNEKMATHPWIRTEIPKALGYLVPSELVHGPADLFIQELAKEIGSIAYDPRIQMEHLHPDAGKAVVDQTYLDARAVIANDLKTFEAVIRPRIPALAQQVTEFIKGHQ